MRRIGVGLLALLWLTPEDSTLWIVSFLGWGISLSIITLAAQYWFAGSYPSHTALGILGSGGLLTGAGAVVGTVFLMVFKNAWHSHAALDFPASVVADMAERLVPWALAGGLTGLALYFWRWQG